MTSSNLTATSLTGGRQIVPATPKSAGIGHLRAHGDEAAVTRLGLRRRYEEIVAYLATRPHGPTVDATATALQPPCNPPTSSGHEPSPSVSEGRSGAQPTRCADSK